MMAATTQAWLTEDWDEQRFATEMTRATRLLLLGLATPGGRAVLLARLG